ncbi:CYTH domain-containing protein [Bacillus songklensis]|uniref:CYTH domain-containing protein n=1 Tax=Bacillus songklensis TaxID=1069116 RepID=A0ABV8B2E3_9BACI
MKQEVEIEFKNLLTEEEFHTLTSHFSLGEDDFMTQENHYFDTTDFQLKTHGSALRIRKKGDTYVLTLKQPHENGLLESHQPLSFQEADYLINGKGTVAGDIAELIKRLGVDVTKLFYFGTLTTKRAQLFYKDGLLVLDHSFYLNRDDYELEFEAKNFQLGQQQFKELLQQFHIPIRQTDNKIRRFYQLKYSQISEE